MINTIGFTQQEETQVSSYLLKLAKECTNKEFAARDLVGNPGMPQSEKIKKWEKISELQSILQKCRMCYPNEDKVFDQASKKLGRILNKVLLRQGNPHKFERVSDTSPARYRRLK